MTQTREWQAGSHGSKIKELDQPPRYQNTTTRHGKRSCRLLLRMDGSILGLTFCLLIEDWCWWLLASIRLQGSPAYSLHFISRALPPVQCSPPASSLYLKEDAIFPAWSLCVKSMGSAGLFSVPEKKNEVVARADVQLFSVHRVI